MKDSTTQENQAVVVLREGGVVLHATEGVWGFACDPFCEDAVTRVAALKGRPIAQGMLVIGHDERVFSQEIEAHTAELRARVLDSWPGAHTWVLPNLRFPDWVTGGRMSVACRVPGHAQARELCRLFGDALVSTSANRTGERAVVSQPEAHETFGELVDLVLPGSVLNAGQPSTLYDLDGSILR